jgi:hypothetical protein
MVSTPLWAEDNLFLKKPAEVLLDIDRDGRMDRARLLRDAKTETVDLSIFLDVDERVADLSRPPALLKKNLPFEGLLLAFESQGGGSLIITSGCGGCSNDYSTTLTIVHRDGQFLVGGYTYDWDTRTSIGRCDINFLTGKGMLALGLDPEQSAPIAGEFKPVKLADWSEETLPAACEQ